MARPTPRPTPSASPSTAAPCPAPIEPLFHVDDGTDGLRARHPRRARHQLRRLDAGRETWRATLVEHGARRTSGRARGRAAVLVNGLGATKYEELFALYGDVAAAADRRPGSRLVAPEVGELVTSLDMAGCSLSVTWLDDELEGYWMAPARHPGLPARQRRGRDRGSRRTGRAAEASPRAAVTEEASEDVDRRGGGAPAARCWRISAIVEEHKDHLGADRRDRRRRRPRHRHVAGRPRGRRGGARRPRAASQTVLAAAGAAFGDKAGGTSGILWGLLLDGVGKSLGNTEPVDHRAGGARPCGESADRPADLQQGRARRQDHARRAVPVRRRPGRAGRATGAARRRLGARRPTSASTAAEATAALVPKIGRARPLAERSVGTPDPGAISMGLIVTAIGEVLDEADLRHDVDSRKERVIMADKIRLLMGSDSAGFDYKERSWPTCGPTTGSRSVENLGVMADDSGRVVVPVGGDRGRREDRRR